MEPVHLVTKKENIADIVLLPGDPLRAKYIADNFLKDAKLVNTIRNMFAFTGYYNDKKITVMGSGMGMPSMGIYAYELFNFYNVKKIIRIGTAGAYNKNIHIGDIVLSESAYTPSNYAYLYSNEDKHIELSNENLNNNIESESKRLDINIIKGTTMTNDVFDVYVNIDHIRNSCPINDKILAKEMEAFALFHLANKYKKEATALMSIVDSDYEDIIVSPEVRETKLNDMIKLALESITK